MAEDTNDKPFAGRKFYIAGPMSGYPDFNFPAFNAAAAVYRELGAEVFNPAERDIEKYGESIINATGDPKQAAQDVGFDLREALGADLAFITAEATDICMLRGWEKSNGARAEHATAVALGLGIYYQ